ncbi:hypothetical protein SUGI_0763180 [Cryptomeria japonica]|nr:hypothetical protein SUGI_0763180 [Cryptomeria japonica]
MVLEVQDGGEGLRHFCSRDIQWTPICVENDSMSDLCAAIPLGRLDAFVRGESLREGVETQFLQKRHTEHASALHNTHTTKMADVAILIFKQPLHVDKNGEACHGVDDTSNELRSQFAPNLSNECKAYRERLLLMDVSVDAIVDRHLDDPVFHDMLKKRDSFVTRKDVINAATRVHSIRSRKHVHDATSILEWKKQDEANFFFFQQPQGADRPFIMGIQTAWMLDMMVRFLHDSIISMDSTFATNKYGYQLYMCLIFDEQQSRVPAAWVVTSRNKIEDIQVWLMELWRRGKEKRPDWRINAFITDDVSAEIQAIE